MKKLLRYELKKHMNFIIMVCLILALLNILNFLLGLRVGQYQHQFIRTASNEFINATAFMVYLSLQFSLLAIFIYFGQDFLKNISSNEKNFLFTIPKHSSSFIMAKIVSITIFSAILLFVYFVTSSIPKFANPSLVFNYIFNIQFLEGILSLFSYSLLALALQYTSIIISKDMTKKIKFKYLWIVPFSLLFTAFMGITSVLTIHFNIDNIFLFVPSSWSLVIVNLIAALVITIFNIFILEKKLDY